MIYIHPHVGINEVSNRCPNKMAYIDSSWGGLGYSIIFKYAPFLAEFLEPQIKAEGVVILIKPKRTKNEMGDTKWRKRIIQVFIIIQSYGR